jgi:hypothetical protein
MNSNMYQKPRLKTCNELNVSHLHIGAGAGAHSSEPSWHRSRCAKPSVNPTSFVIGLFLAALMLACTANVLAQSSMTFNAHSRTSFTVTQGADLSQLTQVDMARMLPVQKTILENRQLDTSGALTITREVLFVSGNNFMAHEVGHITTADDTGVVTRNAQGDTILHLGYDGDYWHPDPNGYAIALQSLFTDPFAGLDSMIGTMPPGMIAQGPG